MFGLTFGLELGEFVGGEDTGGRDGDGLVGTVGCGGDVFDLTDEGTVVDNSTEHDVFPIEVRGRDANINEREMLAARSMAHLSSLVQDQAHVQTSRVS